MWRPALQHRLHFRVWKHNQPYSCLRNTQYYWSIPLTVLNGDVHRDYQLRFSIGQYYSLFENKKGIDLFDKLLLCISSGCEHQEFPNVYILIHKAAVVNSVNNQALFQFGRLYIIIARVQTVNGNLQKQAINRLKQKCLCCLATWRLYGQTWFVFYI